MVRGALPTVWDVEDLARTGRRVGGCGYYASHEAAPKAHLILVSQPCIRKKVMHACRDSVAFKHELATHGLLLSHPYFITHIMMSFLFSSTLG